MLVLGLGDFIAVHIYHSQAVAGVVGLAAAWVLVKSLLALTAETFRGFKRFWPATLYNGLAVDSVLVLAFGTMWIAGVRPSLREAVAVSVVATGVALRRRPRDAAPERVSKLTTRATSEPAKWSRSRGRSW